MEEGRKRGREGHEEKEKGEESDLVNKLVNSLDVWE